MKWKILTGGALLFIFLGIVLLWKWDRNAPPDSLSKRPSTGDRLSPELAAEIVSIEQREQAVSERIWAPEILAEETGRSIENLWNTLNTSSNKLDILARFPIEEIKLGDWEVTQRIAHQIEVRSAGDSSRTLNTNEWKALVQSWMEKGWRLDLIEFRHNAFNPAVSGTSSSKYYFAAQLTNTSGLDRVLMEGDLDVTWAGLPIPSEGSAVKRVDASRLTLKNRAGPPMFELVFQDEIAPPRNAYSVDPLLVHDLDHDGIPELVLANRNRVYRRTETGYQAEPLCAHDPGLLFSAIFGDFDGDGLTDFLCARLEGLALFKGSPQGRFETPGRLAWKAQPDIRDAMVLTCGDVNGDGSLDIFLAQYTVPYELGAVPTPFHDANDGRPSYLLLNDGTGKFSDATVMAGLKTKRFRRTYSASLLDLDADGKLDLAVVSDFAGLDLYKNDGKGRFTDMTSQWIAEPHAFGMALGSGDLNHDGQFDLLMIGMTSPTVDRLQHAGLFRNDPSVKERFRSAMTFGNRLYFGRSTGGFSENQLGASLARSGWSWGCGLLDFDNDGLLDVYIANGHESRDSVEDYEREYWMHDLFVGNSSEHSAHHFYFKGKFGRTRGRGQSYGGYERNRLFMNQGTVGFTDIGHLAGVGSGEDGRNVVATDVDADGRMDLVVTSYGSWPTGNLTLRVYRNRSEASGHWIGFRFMTDPPPGLRINLIAGGRTFVRHYITGDSYRSQHPPILHFGLGTATTLNSAEILWPNGQKLSLPGPGVDRYHLIQSQR